MMPRSTLLFLLCAFCPSSFAGAPIPAPMTCSAKVSLRGDVRHFWLWGRDAWEGNGIVECFPTDVPRHRAVSLEIPVQIRFEGWSPGYGASIESVVVLEIAGFTADQLPGLYGTFRTAGGPAAIAARNDKYFIFAQNSTQQWNWTVSPIKTAAEMSAFLNFGQLIVKPKFTKE